VWELGDDAAAHRDLEIVGELASVRAERSGKRAIDLGAQDGDITLDAVEEIFELRDRSHLLADDLGGRFERARVAAEEVHLDRARVPGQIAEHVLKDLDELDLDLGRLDRDALAHLVDDVVDRAAVIAIDEAHHDVAGVLEGRGRRSHLGAGAAREGADLARRREHVV
jgi:hypothetical protein